MSKHRRLLMYGAMMDMIVIPSATTVLLTTDDNVLKFMNAVILVGTIMAAAGSLYQLVHNRAQLMRMGLGCCLILLCLAIILQMVDAPSTIVIVGAVGASITALVLIVVSGLRSTREHG